MFKTRTVEPYPVAITEQALLAWGGVVRVWDSPMSAIEGAAVVDEVGAPLTALVVEEQLDLYGALPERYRIRYGDREGWVIAVMADKLPPPAATEAP